MDTRKVVIGELPVKRQMQQLKKEQLRGVSGGRCKQMPTEGGGICAVDTVCTQD